MSSDDGSESMTSIAGNSFHRVNDHPHPNEQPVALDAHVATQTVRAVPHDALHAT